MGNKHKIFDYVLQLGLKAPFTKTRSDWDLCPEVSLLYETELHKLSKSVADRPTDHIRNSEEFYEASSALFDQYGPVVWSHPPDDQTRPWLFDAGDSRTKGLHVKDMFYDDFDDRAILRDTFHELAVLKAVRWRQDHPRDRNSSVLSDVSFEPAPSGRKSLPSSQHAVAQATSLRCFAPDSQQSSHLDAALLVDLGVWLGDFQEEKAAVGDYPSFDDMILQYFRRTKGATIEDKERRLHTNTIHTSAESSKYVQCAACRERGLPSTDDLMLQHIELEADEFPGVKRTVWSYPCYLGDRKVFALLKCDQRKRLGPTTALWSFWLAEGGYTSNLYLATVGKGKGRASILQSDLINTRSPRRPEAHVSRKGSTIPGAKVTLLQQEPKDIDIEDGLLLTGMEIADGGKQQRTVISPWNPVNVNAAAVQEAVVLGSLGVQTRASLRETSHRHDVSKIKRQKVAHGYDDNREHLERGPQACAGAGNIEATSASSLSSAAHGPEASSPVQRTDSQSPTVPSASIAVTSTREGTGADDNNAQNTHDSDYNVTPGYETQVHRDRDVRRLESVNGDPEGGFFSRFAARTDEASDQPGKDTAGPRTDSTEESTPLYGIADQRSLAHQEVEGAFEGPTTIVLTSHAEGTVSGVPADLSKVESEPPEEGKVTGRRIKMWLKLRDVPGKTIIVLGLGLSVHDAFDAVRRRQARKLAGREIQALSVVAMSGTTMEEAIDVEIGDEDTWKELNEMVATGGGGIDTTILDVYVEV